MSRLTSLWRNLVHRQHVEQDLHDEVPSGFRPLGRRKVRFGMRMEDARRAARLEFGRVEIVMEHVRDVRAGEFADALRQDLLYAARMLRRNPLFTLTAVLSLAIGIGANTTIFTVANGLFFIPQWVYPKPIVSLTSSTLRAVWACSTPIPTSRPP